MKRLVEGIATAHGASAELWYEIGYPPTVNTAEEVRIAGDVASKVG